MTKRILLIDDDPDIRLVAQLVLHKVGGWDVLLAASGAEGAAIARVEQPDAILLDISMPEMDGFSVFKQLQADSVTQSIPVILLTAKVLPSDRRRFAEMGVAGMISKPFDPATICLQISSFLNWQT
jgi:CheY-like chemotaxis protein